MMISKIVRQKKNHQRYSIFFGQDFAFGVSEHVLLEFGLRKGLELNDEQISSIQQAEFKHFFYQKALHYLSYGLRSEKEVRDHLAQHLIKASQQISEDSLASLEAMQQTEPDLSLIKAQNFKTNEAIEASKKLNPEQFVDQVIGRLKEQQLINDLTYGQAYVRTQATISRKGPIKVAYELKQKGLDALTIEDALMEYSSDKQEENLRLLGEKFIKSKQKLAKRLQQKKLYQHLVQKGYDPSLVKEFIAVFPIEVDDACQEELLQAEGQKSFQKRSKKWKGFELRQRMTADLINKGFSYEEINHWIADHETEYF